MSTADRSRQFEDMERAVRDARRDEKPAALEKLRAERLADLRVTARHSLFHSPRLRVVK